MNVNERNAADQLERYVTEDERDDTCCNEIRTLLAALRRWDRLASEGLNERSIDFLSRYQSARVPGVPSDAGEFLDIVERLQAQLAAAKEAAAEAEGIAGDALLDRGLPRLEEVRRETANGCIVIVGRHASGTTGQSIIMGICRRFGLMAPAGPQPERQACQRCNGLRHISDTFPMEFGGQRTVSRPCPACNQTRNADPQHDERRDQR